MSFELLKTNIVKEKNLVKQIGILIQQFNRTNISQERKHLQNAISSYSNQIKILNNSLPLILDEISLIKELPLSKEIPLLSSFQPKKEENLIKVNYTLQGNNETVVIYKKDKSKFL